MDKIKRTILNDHASRYIRGVMSEQLLDRGYISKNDEHLHWYRLVDGNILQAVYFYSQWAAMPILMGIGYGCHPLFIAPEYPTGIHMGSMRRSREALNPGRMLMKQQNRAHFAPDMAVTCPDDAFCGADILEDILSQLDQVHNLQECYQMHKRTHIEIIRLLELPEEKTFQNMSADFMNEVVFMDDRELYPHCIERIERELQRYERAQKVRKLVKAELEDIEMLNRLKSAIAGGEREQHLAYLQELQQSNMKKLLKKVDGLVPQKA